MSDCNFFDIKIRSQSNNITKQMEQNDSEVEKGEFRQKQHNIQENQTNNDTCMRTIKTHSAFQTTLNRFKNYSPVSNYIDLNVLKQSKYLRIKKSKQYAYYGEIVNNMRQGMGIMVYSDHGVYEGSWFLDRKNGKGYQSYQNGNCYQGDFVDGMRHGYGRLLWKNGQYYEGEWYHNKKEGSGTWRTPKGDSYIGQWKDNKTNGFGVHIWSNGDRYEGSFLDCLKHGFGYQKNAQGDLYKGHFQRGKKNGYGEYYWTDGSYYCGNFKNGKKQGEGVWRSSTEGQYYQGNYKEGKRQGYGMYVWSNGIIYKGQYHDDMKQGYGEMYWPNGQYYKGQWKNDLQHGEAEIFNPNIGVKRCSFINNAIIQALQSDQQPIKQTLNTIEQKYKQFKKKGQKIYNSRVFKARVNTISNTPSNIQLSRIYNSRRKIMNYSGHSSNLEKKTHNIKRNHRNSAKFNTIQKQSKIKLQISSLKKNTVDLSSKYDSPINAYKMQYRKEQIPHSSYYMQQIYRRVKTSMQNSDKPVQYIKKLSQNKLQPHIIALTKPYNLTKLMHKTKLYRFKIT